MTAAAAPCSPPLAECPDCQGYGHVVCCYAYEVEGIGGAYGCRCRRPGVRACSRCEGTGEVEIDPEEVEE